MRRTQEPEWFWPLYEAQAKRCAYCGGKLSLRFATEEHVIPQHLFQSGEVRGTNNRLLTCRGCNGSKGGRLPTEFELQTLAGINLILAAQSENVIPFRPQFVGEAYRLDADQILEEAKGKNYSRLVILGEIKDEADLYVAGTASVGESLILMELAKLQVIGR